MIKEPAKLAIFGSCVTRDAFNLCQNDLKITYMARQSIISIFHPFCQNKDCKKQYSIEIRPETRGFNLHCLQHDISKDTFECLNHDDPLIIDLIEERNGIAVMPDKMMYTYSVPAHKCTNIKDLAAELIDALHPRRKQLFDIALPVFINEIRKFKNVIIHRAFYDENCSDGAHDSKSINLMLAEMYNFIKINLPNAHEIEIPVNLRKFSPNHIWGTAPFHYIDDYYALFLSMLESHLQIGITIAKDASLQKK